MDGLLINTEDINIRVVNMILAKYNRPTATPSILAQIIGTTDGTNGDAFHEWAKLPISREQYECESDEKTRLYFPHCMPLPGAETLLSNLGRAHSISGERIKIAIASGTMGWTYELKVSSPAIRHLLDYVPPKNRIFGFDARLSNSRKKPAPEIYLTALEALNATNETLTGAPILPQECLVFEDSVLGVEAGRRAGMRVIWVPNSEPEPEYCLIEKEVLAGRTKMVDIGDDWQCGEIDDGWAERIPSLEFFDYKKYGIEVPSSVSA
ncbi:HAD superfamily hydrolase [Penicillium macrosclerotiorum]|uniref:HAD superfamily hydrolase n=1 Tax=Penicillium macrosclerotiorum TaxID=303699 RepID=UPI0025488465|nr:HAD superfamily hydrolase [Penicillium macrosclerotiorum]KAJ5688511.1 HAD superfamily hydrolase [Penicillium macrosclerotiorum]